MPRILRADNGEPLIERYVGPSPIGLMADPIPILTTPPGGPTGRGVSSGHGVAVAVSGFIAFSAGAAAGIGDAPAVGAAIPMSLGVGVGGGSAIGIAAGAATSEGVGTATGTGTAVAGSASSAASVGAAQGVGTAIGDPSDTMVGLASGLGVATAVGQRLAASPGVAIGTGVASGISNAGGTGILSVVITRDGDGVNATYTEVGATDLGNYVDPLAQFTQGCKRAGPNATFQNFYVHFRKDVGGTARNEIVFEYGAVFNGPRSYMGPYHASIRIDGAEVANFAVPYHFHFARWRWNPTPRPIRTTGAALIAARMVPPLVTSQTNGFTAAPSAPGYTIMGIAGLFGDMTTSGDRYELGMVTEQQAYWICTGLGSAAVLAQGEASASWPWHHRDETTGGPLNKTTYPQASEANSNSPTPYLATDGSLNGTGGIPLIRTDLAHHPSLAAVPFMMTGDPYYLEEHQFLANWTAFTQNWTFRAINSTSHILETGGEFLAIRASGWMSRTVAQAAKITPASVPSWLLPQSYFQTYNDQLIAYFFSRCITSPLAVYTLFRTIERVFGDNSDTGFTAGTYGQPYMEDYVSNAWSYAAWMHPTTAWVALANWKRGNAVARSNGTSGWEKAETSPYRYQMRATPTGAFYTTWLESWNGTQAIFGFTYTPGVLDVSNQVTVDYGCYIRAAVAWGKTSAFADATCNAPFTYLDSALMAAFNGAKFCSYKWAINPNA